MPYLLGQPIKITEIYKYCLCKYRYYRIYFIDPYLLPGVVVRTDSHGEDQGLNAIPEIVADAIKIIVTTSIKPVVPRWTYPVLKISLIRIKKNIDEIVDIPTLVFFFRISIKLLNFGNKNRFKKMFIKCWVANGMALKLQWKKSITEQQDLRKVKYLTQFVMFTVYSWMFQLSNIENIISCISPI